MAVGTFPFPDIKPVPGLRLGTAQAGIRYKNRDDLLILELAEGATVGGVFTQNAFCAAPVIIARNHLQRSQGKVRYLVINAGNANACTGEQGKSNAIAVCRAIASSRGVEPHQVLPFSTGVVGEQLPVEKIISALPEVFDGMVEARWSDAAKAIMTTDTRPKGATVEFDFNGEVIRVGGIAKGVGMIKPNMATMLAFIGTNIGMSQAVVDQLVRAAAEQSLNRIVVDGDTSTNDACMLMATGQSNLPAIDKPGGELYQRVSAAITDVFLQLARNLVCDGEGATKYVTVKVTGGASQQECAKVAYAVAQSPLVKTAFYASDPNWGRIVVAIGYADVEQLDPSKVSVFLDQVQIVDCGQRAQSYTEAQGQAVMNQHEITITIHLGRGDCCHHVWTTDFSHEYVTINAEYRT